MNDVVGSILPFALVVGLSPIPIIGQILLLFTPRRIPNALGYLVAFTVGVAAVLCLFVALASTQDLSDGSGPSRGASAVRLVLGLVLLAGAVRRFRGRPRAGEAAPMPSWMEGIDSFTPRRSVVMGLLLGSVNPKNLAMGFAAATIVAAGGLTTGQGAVAVAIYTLVAAAGVVVPFVAAVALGARAEPMLESWKEWLGENNATVMAVLLLVFGVILVGQGIAGL